MVNAGDGRGGERGLEGVEGGRRGRGRREGGSEEGVVEGERAERE